MESIIRRLFATLRKIKHWVIAQCFFAFLGFLKLFPADKSIWFVAEAARGLGMKFPRTKIARENIKHAFPEKPDEEVEQILSDMWANLGRLAAEYVFIDKIFDINEEDQSKGRVEFSGIENFEQLKNSAKPSVFFTGHTGNWEILPIVSAVYGLHITALFTPPTNRYIAERVLAARSTKDGHLVPSKAGASWALAQILDKGGNVGLLVDQWFKKGVEIDFLGRQTMANPLLAKLVRQYDCDVYPARCIRLPNGRFRIELEPALEIPRLENGNLDTEKLTQKVNDVVAGWIREYPEQWLWLHKRWRPDHMARRAERLRAKNNSTPS